MVIAFSSEMAIRVLIQDYSNRRELARAWQGVYLVLLQGLKVHHFLLCRRIYDAFAMDALL